MGRPNLDTSTATAFRVLMLSSIAGLGRRMSRDGVRRYARNMFSFLPGIPGTDDLRALARKVDTARHHGVPDGCVLELDLQSVAHETGGFDPFALIASGGGAPPVGAAR